MKSHHAVFSVNLVEHQRAGLEPKYSTSGRLRSGPQEEFGTSLSAAAGPPAEGAAASSQWRGAHGEKLGSGRGSSSPAQEASKHIGPFERRPKPFTTLAPPLLFSLSLAKLEH